MAAELILRYYEDLANLDLGVLKQPIVTPIHTAGPFYAAEDYHQDFYKKSSLRYKIYRYGCGRDARIRKLWGTEAFRGITLH